MANMMDYLDWRGDLSFEQDPFNEVDSLILTEAVYLRDNCYFPAFGDEKTVRTIAEEFFADHEPSDIYVGVFFDKCFGEFIRKIALSERFGHMKVMRRESCWGKEKQRQFCAVTFKLQENLYYIAFKGTDDTLIGWWENLSTLVNYPVVAQEKAAQYAREEMSRLPDGKFFFGGHSKGGNLAVYAGYQLPEEYQSRLLKIYSNDGQGFTNGKFEREKYEAIRHKVLQLVPEDCLVGNLLEPYPCERIVVKPLCSGIYEHDCFKWSVCGNRFVTVADISEKSKNTRDGVAEIIAGMTEEDKQNIVKEMYDIVLKLEANTLTELLKKEKKRLLPLLKRSLSPKCTRIVLAFMRICMKNAMIF